MTIVGPAVEPVEPHPDGVDDEVRYLSVSINESEW